MIVIFSGAQGTGKTTVLQMVASAMPGSHVIESGSRRAWAAYYQKKGISPEIHWASLGREHQEEYQYFYLDMAIEDLNEAAKLSGEAKTVLMDRSVIDLLAFCYLKHENKVFSTEALAQIENHVSAVISCPPFVYTDTFSILFRADPAYPVEDNGMRQQKNQEDVDRLMTSLTLKHLQPINDPPKKQNVFIAPFGTLEAKARFIIKEMKKHETKR